MIIGIDPDTDKSGVAILDGKSLELFNFEFVQLCIFLQTNKSRIKTVVVEAGYLNKSTWHFPPRCSLSLAAKIGKNVGANHETAKKIVEMLEFLQIKHSTVRPTKSKVDNKTFQRIASQRGYVIPKRTNSEQRDAAALIL